jgi:hypothetical protein
MFELDEMVVIRVVPKVISLIDYSQGFGHTDLIVLDDDQFTEIGP